MKMELVRFFACVCLLAMASAQTCTNLDLMFVLDQSENAKRAASTDVNLSDFRLLTDSLDRFLSNPAIMYGTNVYISMVGYSSGEPQVIISQKTSPAAARQTLYLVASGDHSGSWTYRGLQTITRRPDFLNNRIILISSQGSGSVQRRVQAQSEAQRLYYSGLGWTPVVIVTPGANPVDYDELIAVNNNQQPISSSYRNLDATLGDLLRQLCPTTTTTTTTTPPWTPRPWTPPVTPAPSTGICSNCSVEAGYGIDRDPEFCDTFYQCLPDGTFIKKKCPAGTFFDGKGCNHIDRVVCDMARCNGYPDGTKYPSGRCCNKYYECKKGLTVETQCPEGQYFDSQSRQCQYPPTGANQNMTSFCASMDKFVCDVKPVGLDSTCNLFGNDPTFDPCKFTFNGNSFDAPAGAIWDQSKCTLVLDIKGTCKKSIFDRNFVGAPSAFCNATFLATFDNGAKDVVSQRTNQPLDIVSRVQEAQLTGNALTFTTSMRDPYLYYYYFNNRDIDLNAAFRVRFRLDNPQMGAQYDILSNNFCPICPATISFTVSASSQNARLVTATFLINGQTYSTSANIQQSNPNSMLEMLVIFGTDELYGELRESQGGFANNKVQFSRVPKPKERIDRNKCGIQLGRGSQNHFVGVIDEFAVYEYCSNVNQLLQQ